MYCLGFGGKQNQRGEEKKDDTSGGGHYTNMDSLGSDYIPPYEQPEAFGVAQLFPDLDMDGAVMSTHSHSKSVYVPPALRREQHQQQQQYVPLHERESRFQHELVKVHQDRNHRSERSGPQYRTGAIEDTARSNVEAFGIPEQEDMDVEMSFVHETRAKGATKQDLRKENQLLRKDLRRTRRILECEKSQKVALRERMENLEHQVDTLRQEIVPREHSNYHPSPQHVHHLEAQLQELQQKYEEEKLKNQSLQIELDVVKNENTRNQEKLRHLLFQQNPQSTTKFQDIGPVDHNVPESELGVGNYEFGGKLGEGHYGKVAVGRNKHTNQKFAIKVLNKERITRFKDLQQVAIEVHVLRKYPHANIVHLQEVVHAPNNIYLVTELCSMDLHKYHNEIGLSEFGAKQVILGILKPLYHLHSHGICHLDLKPENILLSANTNVKTVTHHDVRLCDFGLVNMARNPAASKEIIRKGYACGTPGFFAPEMILVNEFEGREADMWSLGCIILELTLGFTQEWIDSYEVIESHPTQFVEGIKHCLDEIAPDNYPMHQNLLNLVHSCLFESQEAHRCGQSYGAPMVGRCCH